MLDGKKSITIEEKSVVNGVEIARLRAIIEEQGGKKCLN